MTHVRTVYDPCPRVYCLTEVCGVPMGLTIAEVYTGFGTRVCAGFRPGRACVRAGKKPGVNLC